MGLDMFVYRAPAGCVGGMQVDIPSEITNDLHSAGKYTQLHYWRKHHDMHGWMEQLYRKKGGASEEFNCDTVRLMPEDLDALEQAINDNALPKTEGFFFGNYPPDAETKKEDLDFIARARQAIADGDAVIYGSWW